MRCALAPFVLCQTLINFPQAVTISAFLLLLIEYVAATAVGHNALKAIERKDKHTLPIPVRPAKLF